MIIKNKDTDAVYVSITDQDPSLPYSACWVDDCGFDRYDVLVNFGDIKSETFCSLLDQGFLISEACELLGYYHG